MNMTEQIPEEWKQIPMEMRPKVRYWLPAACVDDEDLEADIQAIYDRGFGGVEVSCRMILPQILSSEEGWGKAHWEHVIDVIDQKTKTLGMTMDLTNGANWPIGMKSIQTADDEAAGYELTWGEMILNTDGNYCGPLPKRRICHAEGSPHLIAAMVYQADATRPFLDEKSYRDVTSCVEQDEICLCLGTCEKGKRWILFVFYEQPTAEKLNSGEYIIDHKGKAGAKACENYWKPQMQAHQSFQSMESIFCDSMEYHCDMEWCHGFLQEFEERRGYSLIPFLPVIGSRQTVPEPQTIPGYSFFEEWISEAVNQDYMETLTDCYCENHLQILEEMAQSFGKSVRYQVAYNKPLEIERSALCVGIPENEALGRCALDSQKAMASAAHLGRKKRYSFECAAEYANAYGQSHEDLMWWVKRSLMAGMNAQVLHGASYSGSYHGKYSGLMSTSGNVPMSVWPGFEAFRKCVSNYWNRTLDATHTKGTLDAIARMNVLFRKTAKVDVAVYRQEYLNPGNASDGYLYDDDNVLGNRGFSYEFVSSALLDLAVCHVTDGLLDPDGVAYQCLVIPNRRVVSMHFLQQAQRLLNEGLPLIWQGAKPEEPQYYSEVNTSEKKKKWQELLDSVYADARMLHVEILQEIPDLLAENGIRPRIYIEGAEDKKLSMITAVRYDEVKHKNYYVLYRYNRVRNTGQNNPDSFGVTGIYQKGTAMPFYQKPGQISAQEVQVHLPENGCVMCLNPWSGRAEMVDPMHLKIEEDQMLILTPVRGETEMDLKKEVELEPIFTQLKLYAFEPLEGERQNFLHSGFATQDDVIDIRGKKLQPWCAMAEKYKYFAGKGEYIGSIELAEKKAEEKYQIRLENLCDTFKIYINGKETDYPDQDLKLCDVTDMLHAGSNDIVIEVVSNLYNKVVGPQHMQEDFVFRTCMPYQEKEYGIY